MTIPNNSKSTFRVALPPAPDLSETLLSYQRLNLFCDVSLRFRRRVVDGDSEAPVASDDWVVFPAHKVVLAAASPLCRRLIEGSSEDVIEIPEPTDDVSMKMIVDWIYGGVRETEVGWQTGWKVEADVAMSRLCLLPFPFHQPLPHAFPLFSFGSCLRKLFPPS